MKDLDASLRALEVHPQSFGNWLARVDYGLHRYEIVGDVREGWLTLWRKTSENKAERLFEMASSTLNESQELAAIKMRFDR